MSPGRADHPPSVPGAERRDPRVDFFPGAALLVMLWDHVVWSAALTPPLLMRATPAYRGLSDAACVFVFLYAAAGATPYPSGGRR